MAIFFSLYQGLNIIGIYTNSRKGKYFKYQKYEKFLLITHLFHPCRLPYCSDDESREKREAYQIFNIRSVSEKISTHS